MPDNSSVSPARNAPCGDTSVAASLRTMLTTDRPVRSLRFICARVRPTAAACFGSVKAVKPEIEDGDATAISSGCNPWRMISPCIRRPIHNSGTATLTSDGRNTRDMTLVVVICPPIQSIVVVTSPIGDHAPPELAAMITTPP